MTADRPRAHNSTLPGRAFPMPRGQGLTPGGPLPRSEIRHPVRPGPVKSAAKKRAVGAASRQPKETAKFTPEVRLQIRTRAGHGDPSQARCEAHGDWLGEHAGEFQHVVARGMGGTCDPVKGTAANGVLLCPEAHRLAETRSLLMKRLGFWQPQGTDPRRARMILYGLSGGTEEVWRHENEPRYLDAKPQLEAA